MTPRAYAELALIAALGLTGLGYVHERDGRLRNEGRLELLQVRADSSARVAAGAVAAAERADTARVRAERQADATRAEGQRRAAAAAASIPRAVGGVIAAAAPADTAAVHARLAELEALHLEREAGLLEQIRADSITIAGLRATHVANLAAIASLQSALAAAQDVGRTALEARPGFIERVLPKLLIGAGAVAGWTLRGLLER